MNTRWHEEDVAGRVLEQIERGIVRGRVISIPAIAEGERSAGPKPGEYLWDDPEGYDYGSFLRARQRESSPMMWSALYQQRPAPEEGDYFKADWLRAMRQRASPRNAARLWRHRLCGDGRWRRLHGAYRRRRGSRRAACMCWTSGEGRRHRTYGSRRSAISSCKWKPIGVGGGDRARSRAGVGPFLDRRQRERERLCLPRGIPDAGRQGGARAIDPRPHGAARALCAGWCRLVPAFRSELLTFPAGKHDDQVDALG